MSLNLMSRQYPEFFAGARCLRGSGVCVCVCVSLARYIIRVDGKRGLFRGLSPRIMSSAISTMVRSKVKQVRECYKDVVIPQVTSQ